MRVPLLAAFLLLALTAAPAPLAVESADACAGSGCPVAVERCPYGGFRVWLLGDEFLNMCIWGP